MTEAMNSCTQNLAFGHNRLDTSLGPRAALIDARVGQGRRVGSALQCRHRCPHRRKLRRRTVSLHQSSSASSKEGRTGDFGAVGANVRWTGPLPQGAATEITTFNWIVDDIVSWTGETIMSSPGGGGVQTAFGARLAGCMCRLCCRVGDDFPDSHQEYMERMGVPLNLINVKGEKTPRAWQLIEENGLRTQVWRTDPATSAAMLTLDAGILPSNQDLQAVHFASSPMDSPAPFVSELRKRNAVMLGHEVYTHNTEASDPDTIRGLVSAASFFSPNVLEAECLLESLRAARDGDRFVTPLEEPGDVPRALEVATELSSIYGDQNLLLRCGRLGAILVGKDVAADGVEAGRAAVHVPAYTDGVMDSTGCGNTFLGAFEGALISSRGDAAWAMCMASAAASVMGEHAGVPPLSSADDMAAYRNTVERRADKLKDKLSVSIIG